MAITNLDEDYRHSLLITAEVFLDMDIVQLSLGGAE